MTTAAPNQRLRVLFVDDEQSLRDIMQRELPAMGHDVVVCESGMAALRALDHQSFDVAIIDLRMPGMSGWDLIDHLKRITPETEVIISTAHGDMDAAIQALRKGVYDFLIKPAPLVQIAACLQRVAEKRNLKHKTIALTQQLKTVQGGTHLIGNTPQMRRVQELIEKIAPTDSSVLILGETGTGKELVARSIHELSRRAQAPFVAVNCGALPGNLVESELFGHRKGAFTGADAARKGLIEVANGGTLFLDELGELDKSMQVKLLRFLESGEVRRVGENEAFHVDVRVVCATNRDLQQMVREGTFREDLLFRINTFEIHLPPLRERKEDIPELARALIARHLKRSSIPPDMLPPETIDLLLRHDWLGNVRELANALEHAVILSGGQPILPEHLPASIGQQRTTLLMPAGGGASVSIHAPPRTLREIEMEAIYRALERHKGDKPKAAAELGIALKTLYNKLNADQAKAAS